MNTKKQLILNKGTEKFIFLYNGGSEGELLDALVSAATSKQTSFDWFDAAVLSFKLTRSLIHEADELLYRDLTDPMQAYLQNEQDTCEA